MAVVFESTDNWMIKTQLFVNKATSHNVIFQYFFGDQICKNVERTQISLPQPLTLIFSVLCLLAALMAPLASSQPPPNISPTTTTMMATLVAAMSTMAPLASAQLRPPNLSPDNLPDTAFTCEDKVGSSSKHGVLIERCNPKLNINL